MNEKIYLLIFFIIIDNILAQSFNKALNALQRGAPWPKEGRNEYRSFQSAFDINPNVPVLEKWKYSTGSTVFASPIISKDGTVYIGTVSGTFYGIHGTTGTKLYSFNCGPIYSTALISNQDKIYVTSTDYYVYQLDSNLNQKWKYKTNKEIYASPIIDSSYNIYFGSYGGIFYCINSDGQLVWSTALSSPIQQSAVFRGSYIYVILNSNKLVKINSADGSKVPIAAGDPSFTPYMAKTVDPPSSFVWSIPVVDEYENIYFGSREGKCSFEVGDCSRIYKFDKSDILNSVELKPLDVFYSSGAIDHVNKLIYFVGGSLGKLYCYKVQATLVGWRNDNSFKWDLYLLKDKAVKSSTIFIASPVITSSGLIIVSNTGGELYIVRNEGTFGTIIWNGYVVGNNSPDILNSVAIGADGTIYVTAAGTLYALGYQYSSRPCSTDGLGIGTSLTSTDYDFSSTQCPSCSVGYYSDSSICEVCLLGSYSATPQAASCVVCQPGKTTSNLASTSPGDCLSCDAGKYSATPSSGCTDCSAGSYSGTGATSCTSCNSGYYSIAGSTSCTICSAGSYSHDSASECIKCSSGYYSAAGSSSCQICNAGTFSKDGSEKCSICPSGSISKHEGSSKCQNCPPGSYSVSGELGSDNCIVCKWPSTTLQVEGSTSCGYFKLFLRDFDFVKRIFQAFVCVIAAVIFIWGIYFAEEHVDESNLRISRLGLIVYTVLPTLEILFDTLYFSEHMFVSKYLFWTFAFIMLCSPITVFTRHLVIVRANPCLYTMYMPEFLRYANLYWLHIVFENYEYRGEMMRRYTYKVEDEDVSFQQWLTYLPLYLGKLFIFHIMILPWIFVSFLGAAFMLFVGLILYQFKIMAIGNVHNMWFTCFTGTKSWNIKDKLDLTVMNESLIYSAVFFSFPQLIIQVANAMLPVRNFLMIEKAAIVVTIIMILWVSVRTFIHSIWRKIKAQDIPLDVSISDFNFLHLDRSLILIVDYRSGELPIDALELNDIEEECPFEDNEEIICLELGEAMVEQAQVREIGGSIGLRSENLLGPFEFLDFWSVFGGNDEENLPTARTVQTSNAIKAIGVHAYHSNSNSNRTTTRRVV